jgi:hypothetical protein
MKIQVVKDSSGKAIASFDAASGSAGVTVTPVLPEGHSIEEVEVPDNYLEDLSTIYPDSAKGS